MLYWSVQKQLYGFNFLQLQNLKIFNKSAVLLLSYWNLYYQWSVTLCKWRQKIGSNSGTACCACARHLPQRMLVRRARAQARIMPQTNQMFCAATTRYSWQEARCLAHFTLPLIIRQQLKCFPFSFGNTLKSIKHRRITLSEEKYFCSLLYYSVENTLPRLITEYSWNGITAQKDIMSRDIPCTAL